MTGTLLAWIKQRAKGSGRNQFFKNLTETYLLKRLLVKTLSCGVPCATPYWAPSIQQYSEIQIFCAIHAKLKLNKNKGGESLT